MKRHKKRIHRRRSPRALTMVEMIVSIVLVGVLMVAALNTVGAARMGQHKRDSQIGGHQLAQDLMTEILRQDYADAQAGADSFGLEADEVGDGGRALWEDVDDYDGWTAGPPQEKDGTEMSDLTGWTRASSVAWVNPMDVSLAVGSNQGAKRITVTVSRDSSVVATLVALRTAEPPPTEACCPGDGTCVDMAADTCTTLGGEPQGADTNCLTTDCTTGPKLLLVVADDVSPTAQELARQALIESWDFRVELIADGALQSEFDAAVADADVAYVTGEVDGVILDTKLRNATIGLVNEEIQHAIDGRLGFASTISTLTSGDGNLNIEDGTHYITSPFGAVSVNLMPAGPKVDVFGDPADRRAPGIQDLGRMGARVNLAVLDTGAALHDGGTAAGRRVQLPWGHAEIDFNSLTADAQTIMQRSIEWAADMTGGGGGPTCGDVYVHDITMLSGMSGPKYFAQAIVWIKDDTGADVSGATVTGDWSGATSSSVNGVTAADGTVMLQSGDKPGGGTFIFTVTDVVKDGCTYNPALNVETSDQITAP